MKKAAKRYVDRDGALRRLAAAQDYPTRAAANEALALFGSPEAYEVVSGTFTLDAPQSKKRTR